MLNAFRFLNQLLNYLERRTGDPLAVQLCGFARPFLTHATEEALRLLETHLCLCLEPLAPERVRALHAAIRPLLLLPPPPLSPPDAADDSGAPLLPPREAFLRHRRKRAPHFYPTPAKVYDEEEEEAAERRAMLPPGTFFLNEGAFGCIVMTAHGHTLYKFSLEHDDEQVSAECAQLLAVCRLAPQYTPAPVQLTRLPSFGGMRLAIQMGNAGEALCSLASPLTGLELGLCLLQSVHFVLLIGGAFGLRDVSVRNVCARGRGAALELRWIDVADWLPDEPGAMVGNARRCLRDLWGHTLSNPTTTTPDPLLLCHTLNDLLQRFLHQRTQSGDDEAALPQQLVAFAQGVYHALRNPLRERLPLLVDHAEHLAWRLDNLHEQIRRFTPMG